MMVNADVKANANAHADATSTQEIPVWFKRVLYAIGAVLLLACCVIVVGPPLLRAVTLFVVFFGCLVGCVILDLMFGKANPDSEVTGMLMGVGVIVFGILTYNSYAIGDSLHSAALEVPKILVKSFEGLVLLVRGFFTHAFFGQ